MKPTNLAAIENAEISVHRVTDSDSEQLLWIGIVVKRSDRRTATVIQLTPTQLRYVQEQIAKLVER